MKKVDGTVMDCLRTSVAIRDETGRIVRFQTVVRDITEDKRRKDALADEMARRRILLEQSRDGIVVLDRDGKVAEANLSFAQMLGYSPEELLQLHVWDWDASFPPETLVEMLRTVDESGDHFETRHRRKDGTAYDVEISTNGAVFAGRKLIFCVCRDITTRNQTERALRKSEEEYRSLFEQSMDAIMLVEVDGSNVRANQAWLDLFGYAREELPNIHASELYENPDDRKDFLHRIEETGHVRDEVRFKKKDGTVMDCERSAMARKDEHGNTVAFQSVHRDVTEQNRAQRALKDSEEKYRSLFELIGDAININAPDGTLLDANQAFHDLFGYTREDISSFNVVDVYANPADRENFLRRMAETGLVKDVVRFRRKDSSVFDCQRTAVARKDESGAVVAYLGINRDITEQKHDHAELERSRGALRRLAAHLQSVREEERAAVAWELHDEVGQALASVNMDLDSLRGKLPPATPVAAHAALDRIAGVLNDTIARLRRLYTDLRPGMLDDLGLAAAIEWQTSEFAGHSGIACQVVRLDEVTLPDADSRLALYRVFQEALDNVVRHSGATKVEVSVERHDRHAAVRICDNGRGITGGELNSPSALGLAAMHERMRACGGTLAIRRDDEGGTVVEATVPLASKKQGDEAP